MGSDEQFLVAQDVYLKSGIHIGTKFKTKYMEQFIYNIRPDGLTIMNIEKIDERLKIASSFLARYNPEDIVVASKRENSWKAVKSFGRFVGCRVFAEKYPPGIMTNTQLENYLEAKIILVGDPWLDKNAINDAIIKGIPIIGLCDTNNTANNLDVVIPCNNKGKKSLGLVFYILLREYLIKKGILKPGEKPWFSLEDFAEE